MSQATIPDLPFNGNPPGTVLFEISNSGTSESTDLDSVIFGLQLVSEKNLPNGYAGLDGSGLLNSAQIPDLSGTYQILTEKDIANGYAGLDATGLLLLGTIPDLPQSRTIDLITDLAARELLANKVTSVGTPGDDTNYVTEKGIRDALNLKQDTLLFTPEDVANKVITVGNPGNDTNYPSEQAVREALDLKEDNLGFTPEDVANKVITVGTPGDDTNYPSEKAVRDALNLKEDSLGFTPEDVANKATDLLTPDNIEYPTTLAVTTFALQYQLLNEKGAVSGYAGLDASQELLLTNFPSGSALQVLRRNAGNNALEFAASASGSPLTTKGDVYTFDTGDQRLPVGADGFILSANSVQATGLEWIVAPVTSPLTTKGDLYTFDTVNQRLPVGTNGQILEADSVEATGLKWVTAVIAITSLNADTATAQTLTGGDGISITDLTPDHSFAVDATVARDSDNLAFFSATTSAELAGVISDETGTGLLVFGTSPVIVTPTIASFVNSVHDHSNAAGGGQLTNTALIAGVFSAITGLGTQSQILNMGNLTIEAVDTPINGTDAANKTYVDNLVNGLVWKDAADIATTGNITLSGEQTIDGVLTSASRVLVKDQTSGQFNGVYTSDAAAWTRTTDADTDVELVNMSIFISNGVVNAGSSWTQTTDLPITVDTTVLVYAQIGAGSINPLTTKGDIFGYDTGSTRIPVGTDGQLLVANSAVALGVEWQDINLPLTTKGDLFTFTTVNARLPVGITGQILSANAAESTGLEWINNDPSPLTSKGDIYTFTTVNERIAVGSNGQILSANAAQATGLEWINVGAQTPITSDIDYDGFDIQDLSNIEFRNTTLAPGGTIPAIWNDAGGINVNVPTGDTIDFFVNAIPSLQISVSTGINFTNTNAGIQWGGNNNRLIRNVAGGFDFRIETGDAFQFQVQGSNDYVFDGTQADFFTHNIVNATLTSGNIVNAVLTWNEFRQTFNPNATIAGLNFGSQGGDPSTTISGDVWYNSSTNKFRANENSVLVDMISAGGAVNSISQLDTNITVTDTGVDGLADFVIDSFSLMQIDAIGLRMKSRFETIKATTISNISSSISTLNNEGNLFDFNNTVATFNSIASTGWQAGSVIYLQFTSANSTGIELIHDFAATNPQEPFWLLNETNYTVNNTNNNQILSFIYDGTYWVQQAFGEITGGDVSGPVSSTNNAISIFDGTTGKLIQQSGSGAQPVVIDDNANMSGIRSAQFTVFNTLPTASTEYIQVGSSTMQFNVQTAFGYGWSINAGQVMLLDAAGLNLNNSDLRFAILENGVVINHAMTWNNFRQIFTPGASVSGINVGEQASDPTVPVDGDLYYQTGVGFRARDAGAWITLGAGGGTGDVVGPGSSTDDALVTFNGATGKLIQESTIPVIMTAAGEPTWPRSMKFTNFTASSPAGSETTIRSFFSDLTLNVSTGNTIVFSINNATEYIFDATNLNTNNKNITIGTSYLEIGEITTPALPSANRGRLYTKDVSTETHLFFIDSSGNDTDITPSGSSSQTPWLSDIDAAGFDLLFKTANPISMGQGATDVLSITYLDDTVDAGVRIGNTDGFISITNESAVVGDNQVEFLMSSAGATTIQNVMNFQIAVADDTGTTPVMKMNFQDSAGGPTSRPLMSINHGATELVRLLPTTEWTFHTATNLKDMGKITLANSTTTAAADRVINLDAADKITWDGAVTSTPNSITFTDSDIFQIFINNALQLQVTATATNFLDGLLQGVAGLEFQSSTADVVGTATDLELNGPTNVAFHIADVSKFFFNSSFLDMGNLHIKNLNSIRDVISGTPIQLKFEGVTSAVNYLEIVNAISTVGPTLSANGTDANIDLNIATKGTGIITLNDYTVLDTNLQEKKGPNIASASSMAPREGNFFDVTGTTTINYIVDDLFWQAGSQITLQFDSALTLTHNAGTVPTNFAELLLEGDVDFDVVAGDLITLVFNGLEWLEVSRASSTNPGLLMVADIDLNANNLINVQNVVHDQSAITYNATLAFDFDVNQEQTLAVTGDLTTLTTSNRAAGKSKSIFITGDTVNRTLTFNTSWRTNPSTATVIITANTFGLLTFGSKGGAETDVFCAYAEFV